MLDGSLTPKWITFNSDNRQFIGVAPKEINIYHFIITVTDGINDPNSDIISFNFTNTAPKPTNSISNQFIFLGQSLHISLPSNLFKDNEGDALDIGGFCYSYNSPDDINSFETTGKFWIKYDKILFILYGTPTASDISKNKNGFYEEFNITLHAIDTAYLNATISFNLTVKLLKPQIILPIPNK